MSQNRKLCILLQEKKNTTEIMVQPSRRISEQIERLTHACSQAVTHDSKSSF